MPRDRIMKRRREAEKRMLLPLLAVLICAADYIWTLWYYGGLYRAGTILSAAQITIENLGTMLVQHIVVNLPALLTAAIAVLILRRDFGRVMGFTVGKKRGRVAAGAAAGVYLMLLAAALLLGRISLLAVAYQWIYYGVFIALFEELIFRAVLPLLFEESKLPAWCVWVLPGLLWGLMHSVLPVMRDGFSPELLMSSLGYVGAACAFYWLRCWSGTLWLPVLIHAALDFTGTLI